MGSVPESPTFTLEATHLNIILRWSMPNDNGSTITSYTVTVLDNAGSTVSGPWEVSPLATSFELTDNIQANTQYTISIVANNANGSSLNPQTSTISTLEAPKVPDAPIVSHSSTRTSLSITWSEPFDYGFPITGYIVTALNPDLSVISSTELDSTTLSFTLSNLAPSQNVVFYVYAKNSEGNSSANPVELITQPAGVPNQSAIYDHQLTVNSLTLSWTVPTEDNGSAIAYYKLHILEEATQTELLYQNLTVQDVTFDQQLNTLTYTVNGLPNSTNIAVYIYAVNGVGESSPDILTIMTLAAPSVPDSPTVTFDPSTSTISLSWTAPNDNGSAITHYIISAVDENNNTIVDVTLDSTTFAYTATGLTPATGYTFFVYAMNIVGQSLPVTQQLQTTSGGTGSTGATGGSSGGNANMSSLTLVYAFTDDAAEDAQITVYGEAVTALTADQTATVEVTKAHLDGLLTWVAGSTATSGATGDQFQIPSLSFNPSSVLTPTKAKLKAALCETDSRWTDENSAGLNTLHHWIVGCTFAASKLDTDIPVAAVKSIAYQGVAIRDLSEVVPEILVDAATASPSDQQKAVRALFEEAVAKNKAGDRSSTSLDMALGDYVTIYLRYTMKQTRRYAADDDVAAHSGLAGSSVVSLVYGGETFDVDFGNADQDAKEESNTITKTYAIRFKAAAAGGKFYA